MQINVQNGTRAGWKRFKAMPKDWTCPECDAYLKYHWKRCPTCGHPRPDDE